MSVSVSESKQLYHAIPFWDQSHVMSFCSVQLNHFSHLFSVFVRRYLPLTPFLSVLFYHGHDRACSNGLQASKRRPGKLWSEAFGRSPSETPFFKARRNPIPRTGDLLLTWICFVLSVWTYFHYKCVRNWGHLSQHVAADGFVLPCVSAELQLVAAIWPQTRILHWSGCHLGEIFVASGQQVICFCGWGVEWCGGHFRINRITFCARKNPCIPALFYLITHNVINARMYSDKQR